VAENSAGGGSFGAWGTGTLSFLAYSSDGATSPIAFTRA
jgi:hypothetical protein